jgi:large subunit ribosomal protein L10
MGAASNVVPGSWWERGKPWSLHLSGGAVAFLLCATWKEHQPMPTERKTTIVADLTDKFSRMQLAMVADYRGLTVAEMAELRQKMRESGAEIMVAKNTLIRLAARETGHQALEPLLDGPTALTLAYDDIAKVAKDLNDYVKASPKFTLRGGLLGHSLITADGLKEVAKIPSRIEVLGQIVGGLQSPLAGLLGILDAPARDLVGVINAPVADILGVLQARITQLQEGEGAA